MTTVVEIVSDVSPEERDAMARVLTRITGDVVGPTSDILFEAGGRIYVVKGQGGQCCGTADER